MSAAPGGGPGGAPSPTHLMPFPPSLGAGGWFSSAEASRHGHLPQIQLGGDVAPVPTGFSQSRPVPQSTPGPQPTRMQYKPPSWQAFTLLPADVAVEEAGRQLACWGHRGAPERYYVKCFIYNISYYITPWSWQCLAWWCQGRCGSQHPGGAGLGTPWSSPCPMRPCRDVSWDDFGRRSPGSV